MTLPCLTVSLSDRLETCDACGLHIDADHYCADQSPVPKNIFPTSSPSSPQPLCHSGWNLDVDNSSFLALLTENEVNGLRRHSPGYSPLTPPSLSSYMERHSVCTDDAPHSSCLGHSLCAVNCLSACPSPCPTQKNEDVEGENVLTTMDVDCEHEELFDSGLSDTESGDTTLSFSAEDEHDMFAAENIYEERTEYLKGWATDSHAHYFLEDSDKVYPRPQTREAQINRLEVWSSTNWRELPFAFCCHKHCASAWNKISNPNPEYIMKCQQCENPCCSNERCWEENAIAFANARWVDKARSLYPFIQMEMRKGDGTQKSGFMNTDSHEKMNTKADHYNFYLDMKRDMLCDRCITNYHNAEYHSTLQKNRTGYKNIYSNVFAGPNWVRQEMDHMNQQIQKRQQQQQQQQQQNQADVLNRKQQ